MTLNGQHVQNFNIAGQLLQALQDIHLPLQERIHLLRHLAQRMEYGTFMREQKMQQCQM